MTKILDLDGQFCCKANFETGSFHESSTLDGAQGVMFQCPLCSQGKEPCDIPEGRRGVMGAHYIICWFTNPRGAPVVPNEMEPGPGRWTVSGTGLEDLTLSPSVNLDVHPTDQGCKWHGWVTNGNAV